jgi:hypothetical protein
MKLDFETFIRLFPAALTIPIFSALKNQLRDSAKRKRLKNLVNVIEAKQLVKEFDKEGTFRKEFILPDIEENYFFMQTGIETNNKSIYKYIEFKEKLGEDFTWEVLKSARRKYYLKFNNDDLIILISKGEKVRYTMKVITGLSLFMLTVFFIIIFNKPEIKNISQYIINFILSLIPMLLGCFLLTSASAESFRNAQRIERRLENLNKQG